MFTSFVSSRSLSVRGSWGTAPSVFWYGAPGGTQGPLGKGGAAERWRVAYPIGIATRHGAKPATTRTYKSRPPPGRRTGRHPPVTPPRCQATTNWLRRKREIKLSHSIYRQSLRHGCAVPPPFTRGRLLVGAGENYCWSSSSGGCWDFSERTKATMRQKITSRSAKKTVSE